MRQHFKAVILSALVLFLPSLTGHAGPLNGTGTHLTAAPSVFTKAGCDDCWHSTWRSHYRWGSYHLDEWHSRWRSHYRLGSYGGYEHRRSFEYESSGYDHRDHDDDHYRPRHYRWSSYRRYEHRHAFHEEFEGSDHRRREYGHDRSY